MLKLGPKPGGGKYTSEDAATISLEEIKKIIADQVPGAFDKKTTAKKAPAKKAAAKKPALKRK
jgi:DNA topoisomerase-1